MISAEGLSPEVRAAIREAARRNAAQAPPPKEWQIAALAPLFAARLTPVRKTAA